MNANDSFYDRNPSNSSSVKPALFLDSLGFIFGMIGGGLKAGVRRIYRGPLRKAWSWKLEVIIGLSGGTYALLAKIGPERYQRVLERVLPKLNGGGATVKISEAKEAPGHWFIPESDNGSVILYFHGGGYVYGSVKTHGQLMGGIACATSARVFAPDYRLAPEHPQPAAIEDACASYRYLVQSGISPKQIVLVGDSSGGGLVVSTLLALRDAGDDLPAAGVCISPWVDLECSDKSFESNSPYDPVTQEACLVAAAAYLNGSNPRAPEVSPLFANLSGLSPLLIQAGEVEVLHDQIVEFAKRAKSAGLDVVLSVYSDMVHVWHMYTGFTLQADKAINEIAEFIKRKTVIQEKK